MSLLWIGTNMELEAEIKCLQQLQPLVGMIEGQIPNQLF